ncbi:MAG TPA: SMC-Scp complex subunit ScpB [Edaphocola sp.]|nr:SMC-Scp complex subunit ScpB [Edaphocola sp.]
MELSLVQYLEALVFAAEQPVSVADMQKLLSVYLDESVPAEKIISGLARLEEKYDDDSYAFDLLRSGGGYRFCTKPAYHKLVAALTGEKFTRKLSATSMETLAIIAYKQPVTKSEIEFIRGVSSDYSIQKLLEKELIYIKGRQEDAIGKPLLYATTPYFMDYLGINDVSELPKLKEIVQMMPVEATEGAAAEPEERTGNIASSEQE